MKAKTVFWIFLLFWIIQSLLTAWFTELYSDEAYYWMYSRYLDWGYFDHPPGVAVTIWLGSFLGKSEIAVRLFTILLTAGAIAILCHLVQPKNTLFFCLCIFCFLSIHMLGFMSLPDTPFFFFALLFMLAYRRFLHRGSWVEVVLLGVSAALMLYSKYHGVLVIFFTVLSNPRLLLNVRFYLAGFIGLLVFLPHIWWQVSHNFPSLQYHLVARATTYRLSQTIDYVSGNLPFHGGLVSVLLFVASFFYKTKNLWEKALQWNLYGTLLFFFFITFKGQFIEPNWTLFCVLPLLYLGYRQIEGSRWEKPFRVVCFLFAGVMVVLKIHLVHPLAVIKGDRVWDFHLSRNYARQVDSLAGNRMIVANTYQSASLLNFYTDKTYPITSLNINSRANQYSLWRLDSSVCNRDVAYVSNHLEGSVVTGRNFNKENLSLLDNVTTISGIRLELLKMSFTDTSVQVLVEVTTEEYVKNCAYHDAPELEFSFFRGTELVVRHAAPFTAPAYGTPLRKSYTFPVGPPQIDKCAVRVYSAKLGGGTNRYAVLDKTGVAP